MLNPQDKETIQELLKELEQLEKEGKDIRAMLEYNFSRPLEERLNKLRVRYIEINKLLRGYRDRPF